MRAIRLDRKELVIVRDAGCLACECFTPGMAPTGERVCIHRFWKGCPATPWDTPELLEARKADGWATTTEEEPT